MVSLLNEKGFFYPISLCIYLLVIQFLLLYFGVYLNKRGIEEEAISSLKQEYYFMSTLKDIENQLVSGVSPSLKGTYTYLHGDVSYVITQQSSVDYKIDYKLTLKENTSVSGTSYFNKTQNKMKKWVEIN